MLILQPTLLIYNYPLNWYYPNTKTFVTMKFIYSLNLVAA